MMDEWQDFVFITVYGDPKAQPRTKARFANGRVFMYTPAVAKEWKKAIEELVSQFVFTDPLTGPIYIAQDFYFKRPQRLMRKKDPEGPIRHIVKPDRDNLEKAVNDAITATKFWKDDCQVCDGPVRKFYVEKGGLPRCEITIKIERENDV